MFYFHVTWLLCFLLIKDISGYKFYSEYNIYHMAWIEIYYFSTIIISEEITIEFLIPFSTLALIQIFYFLISKGLIL